MPSITPPELQGLVAIAREEGLDMKPVLLRVLVDLFIQADGHTPDEVAQFREIAGALSREVDAETALTVACRLSVYDETPPSVGEALISRKDDAARIILADAAWLPRYVLVEQAAAGHRQMAAAVAARAGLEASIVRLLLSRRDAVVDTTLAANTTIRLGSDMRSELLERARDEDAIATALLSRFDLAPIDKAVLFLVADKATRAAILEAAEAMAASGSPERWTAPPPELLTGLELAARSGDTSSLAALLALAFGCAVEKAARLVRDRTGEGFALALVALGAPDDVLVRVLTARDPLVSHTTHRVFALVDMARGLSQPAARLVVAAILGRNRDAGAARHEPVYDPAVAPERRGGQPGQTAAREQVTALRA
ncbi:DUF2336 domain-containing protein [Alsobacter sp. SYSU M60028]|uniref:DUF2336 domain-containing protein n=1 Tax=Alsobacter ponti TaxID=2962936 RepID=A0ABT1LC19_9HYPH|nr:DUF2336 domain-containing protein [Alsobacter ponti]MCP8937803.1 DUF2336 domain-containing protein [Alsobacter ponti]